MDKFLNKKYKHTRSDENYDAYLRAIGLNIFNRKIAKSIPSSTQLVKLTDYKYVLNTIVPFKTHEQKFVPGEEMETETIDGRKIINIFTMEGNKLTEQQIESNRKVTIVREYFDDEMIGDCLVSPGDIRSIHWNTALQ